MFTNTEISAKVAKILDSARVGRLATCSNNRPHVVPVVFTYDHESGDIFIPIDEKKKKSGDPRDLRRIRNVLENANVAFLVDRYQEDWTQLFFVMITGVAQVETLG
ncbi:MAG TPA: pyridoxamine 5'-phosphate oxidase family protein, partial [Nitrososphaera sp.]|nr:pyridoxamine 5'-phosphate oxidase family protein [Nitrososphaera sp.]